MKVRKGKESGYYGNPDLRRREFQEGIHSIDIVCREEEKIPAK